MLHHGHGVSVLYMCLMDIGYDKIVVINTLQLKHGFQSLPDRVDSQGMFLGNFIRKNPQICPNIHCMILLI